MPLAKGLGKPRNPRGLPDFRPLLYLSLRNRVTGAPVRTRESPGVHGAGPSRCLVARPFRAVEPPRDVRGGASRGGKRRKAARCLPSFAPSLVISSRPVLHPLP